MRAVKWGRFFLEEKEALEVCACVGGSEMGIRERYCVVLRCIALYCFVLRCIALYCVVLRCFCL